MKLISVNVGLPRRVMTQQGAVETGIFKEPVHGPVMLRRLNLDGDQQADLTVHGGAEKAAYVYAAEHYAYWRRELPGMELPWGMFGENFTTEGLDEAETRIGDRFRIGSALVMVTQPRLPCHKLALKFGRADFPRQFLRSGRTGFYFRVLEEGRVAAEDAIEPVHRDENDVSVADITRLYVNHGDDRALLTRALRVEALPQSWRKHFLKELSPGQERV